MSVYTDTGRGYGDSFCYNGEVIAIVDDGVIIAYNDYYDQHRRDVEAWANDIGCNIEWIW